MPLWMTPLLRPVWWRAGASSFSITVTLAPGAAWVRAYAVASPTMPAPITVKSVGGRVGRVIGAAPLLVPEMPAAARTGTNYAGGPIMPEGRLRRGRQQRAGPFAQLKDARLVVVGLQAVQQVADVLGGAGRGDAARDLDRLDARRAARVQIARFELGDRGDHQPQAVRADELLGGAGQRLLGEALHLAGDAQVAVALGGVRGEPVVGVEAEPAGVGVARPGPFQERFRRGERGAAGHRLAGLGVCAGLHQVEEAHRAGGGQTPVALQGGLGQVDPLVGEVAIRGLQ